MHGNVWNSGCLDYSEHSNILPGAVKSEYFAKKLEKCKTLGNLMDKGVENFEYHGYPKVPKFKISLMKKFDLLKLPIQTQDHTPECRASGKVVW